MAPKDPPVKARARGHLGDLPAPATTKTRKRWDGFRRLVGDEWLDETEKPKASSRKAEVAVSERLGDSPTAAAAESAENYRGDMWAFGEEISPTSKT